MNSNNLITADERERELFNAQNFSEIDPEIDNKKYYYLLKNRFILYFMQFLQFAYMNNLISETKRNFVADTLINWVNSLAHNNVRVLTNYLYIITLWLKTQTNYEAWQKIKNINTEKDAENFIEVATDWFEKDLSETSQKLNATKKWVVSIGSKDLNQTFDLLSKSLNSVVHFSSETSDVNLKDLHFSVTSPLFFSVYNIDETEYIASLKKTVEIFAIETEILYKVNAKDFFKRKRVEIKKFKNSRKKSTNNPILDKTLDEWLGELKKEFDKKMAQAESHQNSSVNKLNELEKQFAKEHPEVECNEFDDAFDEFLEVYFEENASEEEFEEPFEVEEWYSNKKAELLQEYADAEAEEEKAHKESSEDVMLLNSEIDSLENMIKEYAIFALANQGFFDYPSNIEERDELMNKMSLKTSIPEFLEAYGQKLSKEEIDYLKEVIK